MFENINVTDSFKNSITKALALGRLSHAVILEGVNEEDGVLIAKEIAAYIQCTGEIRPCGVCNSCVKSKSNSHPDIHVLTKKTGDKEIKVDEIRDIKKRATVLPNDNGKSVFIIAGAEYMNLKAQNALLKIFEEPAEHVCFILTCESKSSLLETVISRATVYSVSQSSKTQQNEKAVQISIELLETYVTASEFEFLKKTAVFQKDKPLFNDTLVCMIPFVRDALILASGGKNLVTDNKVLCEKMQAVLTQGKIIRLLETLQLLIEQANAAANHNLIITRFSSALYSIKNS